MGTKYILREFLKAGRFRLSLALGDFLLDENPLGESENGLVFKARAGSEAVTLKFYLPEGDSLKDQEWLNKLKRQYLNVSLLEIRNNIRPYLDYDEIQVQNITIPVLVSKLYKCSLQEYRNILSVDDFLKLFSFLTDTVQFLHSMGVSHQAITPRNILVDDHNEFVLADIALVPATDKMFSADIEAIGKVLRWYAFGNNATDTAVSKVFPSLKQYDRIVERCLTKDEKLRFQTVGEISSMASMQQDYNPETLLQEFSLICRKNFPKELPEFVHCTDQKKIAKLFADFAARKELFDGKLAYFTDEEKSVFSPSISRDGYIKFDNYNQFKVLDIWIHSNSEMVGDYILVHHANTLPEKVNGKSAYRWAEYEERTPITWEEAMNGFAESEGDIVPLDRSKIEFYNRMSHEGYVFIALNFHHNLIKPENKGTLRDYFFRFSFNYVNQYILEDMNALVRKQSSRGKKAEM